MTSFSPLPRGRGRGGRKRRGNPCPTQPRPTAPAPCARPAASGTNSSSPTATRCASWKTSTSPSAPTRLSPGCGKSTILRILAGLLKPTRGEVLCHGKPLDGLNPGIAIVFQSFALYPWMTVTDNIRTVLVAAGLPKGEVAPRAEDAIRMVGLAGFEEAYPRELSGGMKQCVGMARALAVHPELLFMDEPFSSVDSLTAESLRSEIIDIWRLPGRFPSSILIVSHDIKEVAWMADRIVILGARPGRIRGVLENHLPRPRDYRSPELT